jgi:hypothetical protein
VRAFGIYCTRSGQASRLWGYQAMPVLAVSNCRVVSGFATLCWVDMECANPRELGEFYRQVLGWDVTHYPDESAVITGGGAPASVSAAWMAISRRPGRTRVRPSVTTWTWTSMMSRRLLSGAWNWAYRRARLAVPCPDCGPAETGRTCDDHAPRTKITNEEFCLVELRGLEPLTPCLQSRCSSS